MRYEIRMEGRFKTMDFGLWFDTEAEAQAVVDEYNGVYEDEDGEKYQMYVSPEMEAEL